MNVNGIHPFLVSLGFKKQGTPNEYTAECMRCGKEDKMAFNSKKLVGHCWSCGTVFGLKDIVVHHGLAMDHRKLLDQLEELQQRADVSELGFRDMILTKLLGKMVQVSGPKPLSEVSLPEEFCLLSDSQHTSSGRKALDYLLGRGFKEEVLFKHGFGYCATGYYFGRVIVPFHENGKLVYWQARDYTGHKTTSEKILNPFKSQVANGKSDVIFNYDGVKDREVVVICESWGSALAVGDMACGLNGKTLSDIQFDKLKRLGSSFLVMLDPGAESDAWNIAKRLHGVGYTTVATLEHGDPNEVPRVELIKAISKSVPYSPMGHLKAVSSFM
jgi:hypothetical protein